MKNVEPPLENGNLGLGPELVDEPRKIDHNQSANAGQREIIGKVPAEILKRLFSVKEAAVYLATSTGALYKKIQRGIIPAFKDGRRVKFDREELDAYISRRLRRYETKGSK